MEQRRIDEIFMRRCLQLAENGRQNAKPNPMVGAVVVCKGKIIGEGYHVRCGESHAEVNAFSLISSSHEMLLPQSTLYVNLEPCSHYGKTPPCADLVVRKGVRRVVVGTIDPFARVQGRGIRMIRDAGIEVTVGVLEAECKALNKCFFTFHQQRRPYIILKWAQTSNGFIDGHFRALAISTPYTKMLCHKLRAECDAVLVGRVTDEREHPLLNVREWYGKDPLRLVLSSEKKIEDFLSELYAGNVQSLVVEGGAQTHQSFIDARLWDEIRIETSSIKVERGTRAALLPPDAVVYDEHTFGSNTIQWFRRETCLLGDADES